MFINTKISNKYFIKIAEIELSGCSNNNKYIIEYKDFINSLFNENDEFNLLYDITNITNIPFNLIIEHIKLMKTRNENIKLLLKKCAIVLNSSIAENLVQLIFKLKPPICDVKIFNTKKDAKIWLKNTLEF
jgi:hypothetical protein